MKLILSYITISLLVLGSALAGETSDTRHPPYPIDYCLVSGEKLGSMEEPVKIEHEGREIQFCCSSCVETFRQNPDKYLKKLDKEIIKTQSKDYPLTTCVVSGEELGTMGPPVKYTYKNQLVEFCCSGCIDTFNEHPDAYLKQILAARNSAPAQE
ncbi:hypothetical protein KKC97_06265 [bacterium]|nr:hypothetical protein [bacterium]MBU1637256.1 hypothetical protein [bacterium]MBU1920273.1 hypothetical protein [bacterium]